MWVQRKTAARVIGVSPSTLDDAIRPKCEDAERGRGRGLELWLPAIVKAWHEHQIETHVDTAPPPDVDDPMFENADSPALERYRWARAEQEEMKASQMRGELVEIGDISDGLQLMASILRQAIETLQKQHGQDAADVLSDALDEVDTEIEGLVDEH